MNPLISVIIPCYNADRTIYNCLASLKSQTYTNWEAICVDDGSVDMTREVVEHEMQDARIKLCLQPNRGAAKARETGVKYAQGDYVLFLDADDTLISHAFELMLDVFRVDSLIDIVVSGFNIIENGRVTKRKRPQWKELNRISYLKRVLCGKDGWELCAKMYKKTLFATPLYIPEGLKAGEDAVVFIQLVCNSQKVGGCNVPIYNYIQYEESVTHIRSLENAEDTIKAAQIIEAMLREKELLSFLLVEMDVMFLLSYSNSTRKFRLRKDHSLVLDVRKRMRISSFLKLPFYRVVYIIMSYYFGKYMAMLLKM